MPTNKRTGRSLFLGEWQELRRKLMQSDVPPAVSKGYPARIKLVVSEISGTKNP